MEIFNMINKLFGIFHHHKTHQGNRPRGRNRHLDMAWIYKKFLKARSMSLAAGCFCFCISEFNCSVMADINCSERCPDCRAPNSISLCVRNYPGNPA